MSEAHEFSSTRIFWILFILTAVEVAWSFIPFPKWALWGGLLIFAFWKGLLIFTYFMHMKFEGWIVKGLIAPTPVLILIVLFALTPDVTNNRFLVHPVGTQLDPATGAIVEMTLKDEKHGEDGHGEGGDHDDGH